MTNHDDKARLGGALATDIAFPGIASLVAQAHQYVHQHGALISDTHQYVRKVRIAPRIEIALREVSGGWHLTLTHDGYVVLGALIRDSGRPELILFRYGPEWISALNRASSSGGPLEGSAT